MKARPVISAALLSVGIAVAAFAHGGGRDIRGTIVKFDRHEVVVKRTDGKTESVPLLASTSYRVGKSAGEWKSMHEGSRVVVHIGRDGKAIEVHLPSR